MRINTIRKRGLIIILLILIFVLLSGVIFYPFQVHFKKAKEGTREGNFILKVKSENAYDCDYPEQKIYGLVPYTIMTGEETEYYEKDGKRIPLKFCGDFAEFTILNHKASTYLIFRQMAGGSELSYSYQIYKKQADSDKIFIKYYPNGTESVFNNTASFLACFQDPLLWQDELSFKYFYSNNRFTHCSDFIHNFWFEPGQVERVRLN